MPRRRAPTTRATGRGDDEGARARDDQQHEAAVNPRHRRAPADQRRNQRDQRRQRDDNGRVDARETIDERLRGRALGLRGFDQVDDARERRVADAAAWLRTSMAPWPLMVPANTSSPGCLSTGSDSPVIGAWLTSLAPATTRPSSGIFSPGRTRRRSPSTIWSTGTRISVPLRTTAASGGVRSMSARMALRARSMLRDFEMLREREEKDHCRGFRPLPDGDCADDGDRHQDVHVERAVSERTPGPCDGICATGRHRRQREDARRDRPAEPSGADGGGERHAGRNQEQEASLAGCGEMGLLVLEPRTHAGVGDRCGDDARREPCRVMLRAGGPR